MRKAPRPNIGLKRDDPPPEALSHSEISVIRPAANSRDPGALRRNGLHNRLHDAGRITAEMWNWCERYARAHEIVSAGGLASIPPSERVDTDTQSFWPRSVNAATWLRIQNQRMSTIQRALVVAACVQAWRVADVARVVMLIPIDITESASAYRNRVVRRVENAVTAAIDAGFSA